MGKSILFLHYGPGGNAELERHWYGSEFNNVLFWDQPTTRVFSDLIQACENKLNEVFELNNKPVVLWAHSFGCDLALQLLKHHGPKIKRCDLISPVADVPEGFFRF